MLWSLPHVLGYCDFGLSRRNDRHHRVKLRINQLLHQKGLEVLDEIECVAIDEHGTRTNRRVDILAFDREKKKAFIIDPTVRYETNRDLDAAVQEEKERIYKDCFADLKEKYAQYSDFDWSVIGLWFGARGTISPGVEEFFESFGLDAKLLPEISERVLSDSIRMIHYHVYAS